MIRVLCSLVLHAASGATCFFSMQFNSASSQLDVGNPRTCEITLYQYHSSEHNRQGKAECVVHNHQIMHLEGCP